MEQDSLAARPIPKLGTVYFFFQTPRVDLCLQRRKTNFLASPLFRCEYPLPELRLHSENKQSNSVEK